MSWGFLPAFKKAIHRFRDGLLLSIFYSGNRLSPSLLFYYLFNGAPFPYLDPDKINSRGKVSRGHINRHRWLVLIGSQHMDHSARYINNLYNHIAGIPIADTYRKEAPNRIWKEDEGGRRVKYV